MKTAKASEITFNIFNTIFMGIIFIIMVYPFIYVLEYSVSDPVSLNGGLLIIPKGINFASYILCFSQRDVLNGVVISVARMVIGPLVLLLVTPMAAFVITKDKLIGIKFFRKFFIFTMYISGGIIPTYILIKSLHLTNNFLVYILPLVFSAYNMILIKTFIEELPKSMEESAFVDGANDFVLFYKIIFPLCTPVLAAVTLFAAITQWNSLIDTQLYNSMNRELFTLQYVLYNFLAMQSYSLQEAQTKSSMQTTPETLKMAITVISMIPILIIYPFVQRYFTSGLLIGAVKG